MPDQRDTSEAHQLVERALTEHESALLAYTSNILNGDVDRARDVVQDALLKLYLAEPDKVRVNLKAWLYTVCRNRALDVLRKEQRMDFGQEALVDQARDDHPDPSNQADVQELSDCVWDLVGTLSANQQEVVKLKFQHDCSYQQISEITGITVGNVGFLLHTALKKLRILLQRQLAQPKSHAHLS